MNWTNVEVKGNRRRKDPVTHRLTKSVSLTASDNGRIIVDDVHPLTKSVGLQVTDTIVAEISEVEEDHYLTKSLGLQMTDTIVGEIEAVDNPKQVQTISIVANYSDGAVVGKSS